MTDENPLDFNDVDVRFLDLGAEATHYVSDAIEQPPDTRRRAVAVLAAARKQMLHFANTGIGYESSKALNAIAGDLERVEYALRDLEDGAPPSNITAPIRAGGRPPESNAVIDFQARVVAAVTIMRQLPTNAVSKDEAVTLVAPVIPRALLQPHPKTEHTANFGTLTRAEQLAAWLGAFGRKGSRRYGRLHDLWFELNIERGGFARGASTGDVLEWLKAERDRLLPNQ